MHLQLNHTVRIMSAPPALTTVTNVAATRGRSVKSPCTRSQTRCPAAGDEGGQTSANALAFEASSSPSSGGEEANLSRDSRISFEAGFEEATFAPQLPPRYQEEGRASTFPHVVSLPVFFTPVRGGTGGVVQYRPGDYLACLVSPI